MSRSLVALVSLITACTFSSPGGGDDGSDPNDPNDTIDPNDPAAPDNPFGECAGGPSEYEFDGDMLCLIPTDNPTAPPLVVIEHAFEDYNGTPAVHVRLTFNPTFADNTYGTGSVGWGTKLHKFTELVGSDHAQVFLVDANNEVIFDLDLDYISQDPNAPCGYASLGPFGGDGGVNAGDETLILGWQTSLDENLNDRGYCLTVDSPRTTSLCEPPAAAPDWDFRVVYEIWVAASAFDPAGFGAGRMEAVHASPSKSTNTIEVTPVECPPDGGGTDGCLDPDGCPDPDPCGDIDCPDGSYCSAGECYPVVL